MAVEIKIPEVGESVTEGLLAEWSKPDGAWVEKDEQVLVLESDKAAVKVNAEESGRLKVVVPEGETVKIGQAVGEIDTEAQRGPGEPSAGEATPKNEQAAPEADLEAGEHPRALPEDERSGRHEAASESTKGEDAIPAAGDRPAKAEAESGAEQEGRKAGPGGTAYLPTASQDPRAARDGHVAPAAGRPPTANWQAPPVAGHSQPESARLLTARQLPAAAAVFARLQSAGLRPPA